MQTKVLYLMHTVEKPYLDFVPQLGQTQFAGRRESCFIACSGERGMVAVASRCYPPTRLGTRGGTQLLCPRRRHDRRHRQRVHDLGMDRPFASRAGAVAQASHVESTSKAGVPFSVLPSFVEASRRLSRTAQIDRERERPPPCGALHWMTCGSM